PLGARHPADGGDEAGAGGGRGEEVALYLPTLTNAARASAPSPSPTAAMAVPRGPADGAISVTVPPSIASPTARRRRVVRRLRWKSAVPSISMVLKEPAKRTPRGPRLIGSAARIGPEPATTSPSRKTFESRRPLERNTPPGPSTVVSAPRRRNASPRVRRSSTAAKVRRPVPRTRSPVRTAGTAPPRVARKMPDAWVSSPPTNTGPRRVTETGP